MINKKALYTFAILASGLGVKIDASSLNTPGEVISGDVIASNKVFIQESAKHLLKTLPIAEAKATPDLDWQALIIIECDMSFIAAEKRDQLEIAILDEIKAQLAAQ